MDALLFLSSLDVEAVMCIGRVFSPFKEAPVNHDTDGCCGEGRYGEKEFQ